MADAPPPLERALVSPWELLYDESPVFRDVIDQVAERLPRWIAGIAEETHKRREESIHSPGPAARALLARLALYELPPDASTVSTPSRPVIEAGAGAVIPTRCLDAEDMR